MKARNDQTGVPPAVATAYHHSGSLWERLKAASSSDWDQYLRNEFIWHLADGSLDPRSYRYFVEQDYIYCINFARVYALAVYKSRTIDDMVKSLATMNAVLNKEVLLHRRMFEEWHLSDADIDVLPEAAANLAYTRYLIDVAMRGDVLDLHTALSVCVIGYGEVGTILVKHAKTKLDGNPFRSWIEQYAGDEYQAVARAALRHLDEIAQGLLTEARFAELVDIFGQTLRLDVAFWDMALHRKS